MFTLNIKFNRLRYHSPIHLSKACIVYACINNSTGLRKDECLQGVLCICDRDAYVLNYELKIQMNQPSSFSHEAQFARLPGS